MNESLLSKSREIAKKKLRKKEKEKKREKNDDPNMMTFKKFRGEKLA